MPYCQIVCNLVRMDKLNSSCFDMSIFCPEIAQIAKAGQFLHIRCAEKTLRRPISICEIDNNNGIIRLVFDIRGEGTLWLSERKIGDNIDVLGPLGNGFDTSVSANKALFVGGGMGVPPLLEAAKSFNGSADAILGFRNTENAILIHDFQKACANVQIASDDGSIGKKGLVTFVLTESMKIKKYDVLFACGPAPMLKTVFEISKINKTPCFVSLEERMGCGIGACLVCACKINSNKGETYQHVCKDGPIFNAEEVVW
jgi:dihydroorotate dehydrogenase electron transfer subunit